MIDGYLFLSDYLDLLLVVGYMLLLISTFVLIMVARYHVNQVEHLDKQVEYWRQKALTDNQND
mgnify:CR=1 FL=1